MLFSNFRLFVYLARVNHVQAIHSQNWYFIVDYIAIFPRNKAILVPSTRVDV